MQIKFLVAMLYQANLHNCWVPLICFIINQLHEFFHFFKKINQCLILYLVCTIIIGTSCFRGYGRRDGERRRKSVRGCIVSQDLSVLNLVIVKKGDSDLPGLTDIEKPRMRGPKRASKIRKLFNLSKEDDVRKYVNTYRREFTTKTGMLFTDLLRLMTNFMFYCGILLSNLSLNYRQKGEQGS